MNQSDEDPNAYEVFAQFGGAGKPVQYLGSVRAGDPTLAWYSAKETYTRREDCTQLWVVPRDAIVRADPVETVVLGAGSGRRFRQSAYPSRHRRNRSKKAGESAELEEG